MVKNVHKWKTILTRPLGRPKDRWEDDKRNDMKKLKIKNWTSCIQDRNNWKGGGGGGGGENEWGRRRRRSGEQPAMRQTFMRLA
jgi:hypothetical protein